MPPHHRLDLNRWSNPHGVRETADGQFQNVRRVERFHRHDGRAAAWPEKPSICAHEIFLLNTGRPSSGTAPTWKTRFVKSISMVVAFFNGSPSLWLGCAASPSGYTMPSGLRQTPRFTKRTSSHCAHKESDGAIASSSRNVCNASGA